jgi:serine/threonine protein kinase
MVRTVLTGMVRDETKNDVYMVLPFIEYDLDHAINAINTPFNTAQLRHLMNQLLLTVCYLHSAHIVHRYTHQACLPSLTSQHVQRVLQISHSLPRLAFARRDIQPTSIMISHAGNGRIWLTSLGKARNLLNKPFGTVPSNSENGSLCLRVQRLTLPLCCRYPAGFVLPGLSRPGDHPDGSAPAKESVRRGLEGRRHMELRLHPRSAPL